MKKIGRLISLIFGVLFLIHAVFSMYMIGVVGQTAYSIIGAISLLIGVFLVQKSRKPSERVLNKRQEKRRKKDEKHHRRDEKRRKKEEQEQIALKTIVCKHFVGLPLGEKSAATLFFGETALQISGGGNQFSLAYAKIYEMEIRTDAELHQAYVSSAGGAIGGAALFGPIGGMIGGRVQEKRTITVEHYLIISYDKDGETQYMSFSGPGKNQAMRNINQVRSQFAATRHTVL